MPDLALSVQVTRDQLSLDPLEINDHLNYYVSPTLLGGQVTWNRNQVGSPWLDGMVTTHRTRQMVTEQLIVEVRGDTQAELKANVDTLVQAFIQDSFRFQATVNGTAYHYQCEAADYQVSWSGPRMVAQQVQCTFSIPRLPVALSGVV